MRKLYPRCLTAIIYQGRGLVIGGGYLDTANWDRTNKTFPELKFNNDEIE